MRQELGFRIWYGVGLATWLRVLARNALTVSPWQIPRVVLFTALAGFNSGVGLLLRLIFAQRIRAVKLDPAPVFVLGHWRSGTTYLYELLSCDERFVWPKGYQCGSPYIFLLLDSVLRHVLNLAVPARRPMDDMAYGLDRPQEDEFALLGLQGRSTLRFCMFPGAGPTDQEYLSLRALTPTERGRWIEAWVYFLKSIAVRRGDNARLLLKSPQHTARVRAILSVFPQAKFIHITRNPLEIFSSTVRTWNALADTQGLQGPGQARSWAKEHVLSTFVEMYACYEEDRSAIPAGNLIEVRYEDLVADPIAMMRHIYERLGLGEIEPVLPALQGRLRESSNYKTNVHAIDTEDAQRVASAWSSYAERYGYDAPTPSAALGEEQPA